MCTWAKDKLLWHEDYLLDKQLSHSTLLLMLTYRSTGRWSVEHFWLEVVKAFHIFIYSSLLDLYFLKYLLYHNCSDRYLRLTKIAHSLRILDAKFTKYARIYLAQIADAVNTVILWHLGLYLNREYALDSDVNTTIIINYLCSSNRHGTITDVKDGRVCNCRSQNRESMSMEISSHLDLRNSMNLAAE